MTIRGSRLAPFLAMAAVAALLAGSRGAGWAQQQATGSTGPAAGSITVLVDQLTALFPSVEGEVLEVRGSELTLSVGRKDGVRPGLELEAFRQGREIKHPRTGQVLGRAEETVGRLAVVGIQEAFSMARITEGQEVRPGDRFRTPSAKAKITVLPMTSEVRQTTVEAAVSDLVERLGGSGRFQTAMGDAINVFLAERGIKPEEFLDGKGVREAAERYKVEYLLAIHFKRVQNRPYMDVRFFSPQRPETRLAAAFFVPASVQREAQRGQFSASGRSNAPQARQRSLLERLLGGDVEPGTYSAGESTMPLREVARFGFPVLAMDVSMTPKDGVPRLVVSDGERVYQYRLADGRPEPEWTFSLRKIGRIFSVQYADLDGDGLLEVIGQRFHSEAGLSSFVIEARTGKPRLLADDIEFFLFALDTQGKGVNQTLWAQPFDAEAFFTPGQAEEVKIRDGRVVREQRVRVHSSFRPMGATFSNIMGKNSRVLAFVDEFNRLRIASEGEELWSSATAFGGSGMVIEQKLTDVRGGRSKFHKMEPTPLSVDLDGDGIEELVVPQNVIRDGLLGVVFRGPAGFRSQSVDSGFQGSITAMGAFRLPGNNQPTLVLAVVRFTTLLKTSGETQVIMTVPQD